MSLWMKAGVGASLVCVALCGVGCGGDEQSTQQPKSSGFSAAMSDSMANAPAKQEPEASGFAAHRAEPNSRFGSRASERATMANRPPLIRSIEIEQAEPGADGSERWRAEVEADDPDGDSVRYDYTWFVNDAEVEADDEFFPAGELVRGDRLAVEVRGDDGRTLGRALRSGTVTVGNSPPTVVSRPPRIDARGKFLYPVQVEDADGDKLFEFSLGQAPPGMEIDREVGIVTWSPRPDQAGRHEVEIVVKDAAGSEATQSFQLALITITENAGPAAPR